MVVRDMVLSQLTTLGFESPNVLAALQNNVHDNTTASYYLLYNKIFRVLNNQNAIRTDRGIAQNRQHRASSTTGSAGAIEVASPYEPKASTVTAQRRHTTQEPPAIAVAESQSRAGAALASQHIPTGPPSAANAPPTSSGVSVSVRRPNSVRSGRNLVLMPPSSSATAHNNSLAVQPMAPPRGACGAIVVPKPPGSSSGARVSVSNGMVALTPIANSCGVKREPQMHLRPQARRHTLEVGQHISPRSATIVANNDNSAASSHSNIVRRRVPSTPPTPRSNSSALPPPNANPHGHLAPAKEDDSRAAQTSDRRIPMQSAPRAPLEAKPPLQFSSVL